MATVLEKDVEKVFGPRVRNKAGQGVYISYRYEGQRHYIDLLHVDAYDVETMPTKKDCRLFRYYTYTSLSCGMAPAIMINIERSLIYFWNEETNNWDTKGIKAELWADKWDLK